MSTRKMIPPDMLKDFRDSALGAMEKFSDQRVLVVGDIGIDEYIQGEVYRISPEAPVPILNVDQVEHRLGMAANVAHNIKTMGGRPSLIGVSGDDSASHQLIDLLEQHGLDTANIVKDSSRPTTKKTRVINNAHHIVRVDYENKSYVSSEVEGKIFDLIQKEMENTDLVIIEDYNKGLLSKSLMKKIVQLAKEKTTPVLVDPHITTPLDYYQGVDLITPNLEESYGLLGFSRSAIFDENIDLGVIAQRLKEGTKAHEIVITEGKNGMSIFQTDKWLHLPTEARQVFDVTGAGDTVISGIALGLASGLSLANSCFVGNIAAGIVVGHVGCVPCHQEDLREALSY